MKNILITLLFSFVSVFAFSQTDLAQTPAFDDEDLQFALTVRLSNMTLTAGVGQMTITQQGSPNLTNKFTNYGYDLSDVSINKYITLVDGSIGRITAVTHNGLTADITYNEITSNANSFGNFTLVDGAIAIISDEDPHCGLLSVTDVGLDGATSVMVGIILNFNAQRIGNCANRIFQAIEGKADFDNYIDNVCGIPAGPIPGGNKIMIDTCDGTGSYRADPTTNGYIKIEPEYTFSTGRYNIGTDSCWVFYTWGRDEFTSWDLATQTRVGPPNGIIDTLIYPLECYTPSIQTFKPNLILRDSSNLDSTALDVSEWVAIQTLNIGDKIALDADADGEEDWVFEYQSGGIVQVLEKYAQDIQPNLVQTITKKRIGADSVSISCVNTIGSTDIVCDTSYYDFSPLRAMNTGEKSNNNGIAHYSQGRLAIGTTSDAIYSNTGLYINSAGSNEFTQAFRVDKSTGDRLAGVYDNGYLYGEMVGDFRRIETTINVSNAQPNQKATITIPNISTSAPKNRGGYLLIRAAGTALTSIEKVYNISSAGDVSSKVNSFVRDSTNIGAKRIRFGNMTVSATNTIIDLYFEDITTNPSITTFSITFEYIIPVASGNILDFHSRAALTGIDVGAWTTHSDELPYLHEQVDEALQFRYKLDTTIYTSAEHVNTIALAADSSLIFSNGQNWYTLVAENLELITADFTLPPANENNNMGFIIKNIGATNLQILTSGENIDLSTSVSIAPLNAIRLRSKNGQWWVTN